MKAEVVVLGKQEITISDGRRGGVIAFPRLVWSRRYRGMSSAIARTHTNQSNRAKDTLERKVVYKSVLENPFQVAWCAPDPVAMHQR